jgi:hypothetical protein
MTRAEITPNDKDRLRRVRHWGCKASGQPAPVKVEAGKTINVEFSFDDSVKMR